jgi:hypothetical protein
MQQRHIRDKKNYFKKIGVLRNNCIAEYKIYTNMNLSRALFYNSFFLILVVLFMIARILYNCNMIDMIYKYIFYNSYGN